MVVNSGEPLFVGQTCLLVNLCGDLHVTSERMVKLMGSKAYQYRVEALHPETGEATFRKTQG